MQRLTITALLGLAFASLSFGLTPAGPPAPQGGAVEVAPPLADGRPDQPVPDAAQPMRQKVLAHLQSQHTGLSRRELDELATTVVEESGRHGMNPELVLAVMQVESHCYNMAVSPVGALGLMQLLPSTGEELAGKLDIEWRGPQTLFDPIVNVKLGVAYLRELSDRYRHVPTALAAYNWGPARIDRRLRRGARLPSLYSNQVMRAYEIVSVVETGGSS